MKTNHTAREAPIRPMDSAGPRATLRAVLLPGLSALLVSVSTAALAQTLPTNGSVAAGSASISSPRAGTLNINQSSNQAIINWQSFSVGAGGTVNFNQPGASSATLNRVTGSTPSSIAGTINAPGTVLLINPNGIAITKSGVVNTGSFAASTLDIKDQDFLAGKYSFSGNGASAGVVNNGRINVSDGGFAALLGGQVSNNGVISARLGKVGLGAGEQMTLDLAGDGFLSVAVPSSELGHLVNADGALVSNKGKILANGGTVFLSAATAHNILRDAVNIGGLVRTNSVGTRNGRIVINGGGGGVRVTGRLIARSRKGHGGEVDITSAGAAVKLAGAKIDVSGKTGGGNVNIGGGPHATTTLADAQSVSIDSTTTIKADATGTGDGGHVVLWSDGLTTASGTLSATGGANGGNGGQIETSGASVNFNGIRINASAVKGTAGTWLIDPTDLTIDSAAASAIGAALNGGSSVTLQTNVDGTTSTGFGTPSSGNGDITFTALIQSAGSFTSVLTLNAVNNIVINNNAGISTNGSFVAQAGGAFTQNLGGVLQVFESTTIVAQRDITINSPIFSSGSTVGTTTITSAGNIFINAYNGSLGNTPTLNAGGVIQINAGSSAYTFLATSGGATFNAGGDVDIAVNIDNSVGHNGIGTVTLRADSFSTGTGSVNFTNGAQIVSTGPVNIFYNPASYSSPTDYRPYVTAPNQLGAYMLVNSLGNLQAIDNNLSGSYALGRDIDAGGANFTPIGFVSVNVATAFTGTFDGENHVISNLNIVANSFYGGNVNGQAYGSAVFEINSGTIRNVGLVGGSVTDSLNGVVGSLVAWNNNVISSAFSTLSVSNVGTARFAEIGGLVGHNNGTISNSYATGSVSAVSGDVTVGGLVGGNNGTIQNSYATGSVTANGGTAGGLVGENYAPNGLINYTYATGAVHGGVYTGGLVGQNDWSNISGAATILNSYAAGALSGGNIGGLVGNNEYDNRGTFTNGAPGESAVVFWSIWDADRTGTTRAFGASYYDLPGGSSPAVQYIGFLSADSSKTSSSGAANLGSAYSQSSYSYFYDPTPFNTSFNLSDGSTINASGTTYANSFASHWYMVEGSTRPFLTAEWSPTIQNAHQLQLMDLNNTATYTLARNISYSNDGMWTSAGFSPIAPVLETDIPLPTFGFGSNCHCVTSTVISMFYQFQGTPTSFTGTLNGNGYTISNLVVNTGGNAGLFDTLGAFNLPGQGTVENLGIVNGSFTSSTFATGTIAGINYGTITNSWALSTTDSAIHPTVNGLVYSGGLVGINNGGATISQSYASVTVAGVDQTSGGFADSEGGLAGFNGGTISNSYATGNVLGNGKVGGLVGYNSFGVINDSYATGQLFAAWNFGIANAGPLVGFNSSGSAVNSVWNSDSWNASLNSTGAQFTFNPASTTMLGTGLSTATMQDLNSFQTNYVGWDFSRIWAPPNQAGQGGLSTAYYPELYSTSNIVVLAANNATQQYGGATPNFTGFLYSLADIGRLAAYGVGPLSSQTTSSSQVGTYSIGFSPQVLAVDVGTTVPSCAGGCPFLMTINGVAYQLGFITSVAVVVTSINSLTGQTGVTASVDAGGHLVLTAAASINVSALFPTVFGDPFGIDGTYLYTPPGAATASMLNGSAPRTLFLPGTLTVTPAPLTVTANDATKTYGQSVTNGSTGYQVSGLLNSDSVTSVSYSSTGLGATASVNGGPYSITPSNAQGAGVSNYDITYVSGTLTVQPATLTYTANSASMTYSSAVPALSGTVTGFVSTDTLGNATTGTLSWATNATSSSSVGSFFINGSGLTAKNGNYTFVQAANNSSALTVNAAQLNGSVVVSGIDKTYNGTNTAGAGSLTLTAASGVGVVSGQTVTLTTTGGTYSSANAGNWNVSGLTGLQSSNPNYILTGLSVTGSGTISQATLTLSGSRTYDGTMAFSASAFGTGGTMATGVNGETLIVTGAGSVFGPNVIAGPQALILGSLQLTNGTGLASNYLIATNGNIGTINPAPVTVTALSGSSVYGQSPANPGLSATGLQNGEGVGVLNGLSNSFGITNASNANSYVLSVQGSLTNPNYTVTGNVNGSWTVNPATLTITAKDQSKTYGQAFDLGSTMFTETGLVTTNGNADSIAGVTLTSTGSAASATVVSPGPVYAIVASAATGSGLSNYTIIYQNAPTGLTVNPATLTITAKDQSKTYGQLLDLGTTMFTETGLVTTNGNGDSITGVTLTSAGAGALANVVGNPYAIASSGAAGSGLANYSIVYQNAPTGLTVNPAPVVVTANGGNSVYGQSPLDPGLSAGSVPGVLVSGLQNGQGVGVLTGLSNSFGITNLSNAGGYALSVLGALSNPNYVVQSTVNGNWTVNPATLQYVANPSTQFGGLAFSAFTGTVTGFVNGQALANATTGTLSFTTPATPQSTPGTYGIFGSGLTANFGNYVFVQAPGNATALTLNPLPTNPPSHETPPPGTTPSNQVGITFSNTGANVFHVSFTTTVNTTSLTAGDAFMHNHGLYFPPISQYDADQYSDFKLPPYATDDSEATILTILARGIAQANASKYLIDGFWNGADNTWPGAGHVDLLDKASFSDGAGHLATPTIDPAFPIVSGTTDLAALLKNGPVMIGGPADQQPGQWMLATAMAPDGKGIICDDTMTGGLVELGYDSTTKTIGGVIKLFDARSNLFVPLANASNGIPAYDAPGLTGLQSFVPSTYYAVTVH